MSFLQFVAQNYIAISFVFISILGLYKIIDKIVVELLYAENKFIITKKLIFFNIKQWLKMLPFALMFNIGLELQSTNFKAFVLVSTILVVCLFIITDIIQFCVRYKKKEEKDGDDSKIIIL